MVLPRFSFFFLGSFGAGPGACKVSGGACCGRDCWLGISMWKLVVSVVLCWGMSTGRFVSLRGICGSDTMDVGSG